MHSHRIAHRDIKGANLLVSHLGLLKISDFGLSVRLRGPLYQAFTVYGTLPISALEILHGRGHNEAVDWWSMGIFAYELLADVLPFPNGNYLAICRQISNGFSRYQWSMEIPKHGRDLITSLCHRSPPAWPELAKPLTLPSAHS